MKYRSPILRFFTFSRLPKGSMQEVSKKFSELAEWCEKNLPEGAEKSAGLRKLLEGKDCAVRSMLPEE